MKKLIVLKIPLVALVFAVTVALFSAACSEKKAGSPPPRSAMNQPVPVTVAEASMQNMPIQLKAIGNVTPYSTVTIKSLVDGEIQRAYFTQGEDVKKGDRLFTIDPRPFRATLDQAQANLARDKAQAQNAQQQVQRYRRLVQEGIISKDQFDTYKTNADATEAAVHADQAAVEHAKIQLNYCSIYSPVTGRTGTLLVNPGNLVKNNDTRLVVINQVTPIYVEFSVPEQYLEEIKSHQRNGRLRVLAGIPKNSAKPSAGWLSFINNAVDSSTGTIMLRATFPNGDRRLWPGQFVNVTLDLAMQPHVTVVPSQAVQTGQQGQYIYVVTPNHKTEIRPVEVGNTLDGMTVISRGIKPGETVVTNGQLRLYPGATVMVKKTPAGAQESTS